MSLAGDTTKPGANYARTFAELIRLCNTVVITAQVPRATPFLTINRPLCLQAPKANTLGVLGAPRPAGFFTRANKNIAPALGKQPGLFAFAPF